jgi:hypothetical protein
VAGLGESGQLTVVGGLEFDGRDVAAGLEQAAVVEPVDVLEGGDLDLLDGPPRHRSGREVKSATQVRFGAGGGLELLLKERLRREHPVLVYADVDKGRTNTVSFTQALQRLGRCGVQVEEADHAKSVLREICETL